MKKVLCLLLLTTLIISCKTAATKSPETKETISTTNTLEEDMAVYFKATGNEPFWGLKMSKDKVVFTSMIEGKEDLSFLAVEPIRAMDANVKMYRLSNATTTATVTIMQSECQNSMSGAISPYKVSVEIKNKVETTATVLEGCGKYITDYRLYDIWVLEELNGKKITTADFQRELPRIEINASENRFTGFGGCNHINGSIFYEKDLLRFMQVISTLMACAPGNKEDEFVKALQSSTTYAVGNNRLTLSNPSGKLLVFKKVD